MTPEEYDAWYETERGAWIGEQEYRLIRALLHARPGASILDVGSGTGYFSRRLHAEGFAVTALDPDSETLSFAARRDASIPEVSGTATRLPFADLRFDHSMAITSLCFVAEPEQALGELYRVARRSCVLGLLNRHSLLYRRKAGKGGYRGARWDSVRDVRHWCRSLQPSPTIRFASGIVLPGAGRLARLIERLVPRTLTFGGFLAIEIRRPEP